MRDVALVPQGNVLQADDAVCAHHSGHPADALRKNRIALVRHSARSLLSGLEFFLGLANFRSLPMTNLQGEFLERSGNYGQRAKILRVIIALNDLRRDGRGLQTEPRADLLFDRRVEMRKRPDSSADFSDGYSFACFR